MNKHNSVIVEAIHMKQCYLDNQSMFVSCIRVSDLINNDELFGIQYHSKENPSGYQRHLETKNVKAIRKFLYEEVQNPIMPSPIIINFQEGLQFKRFGDSDKSGLLTIDTKGHIIDGQHKFEGFKLAYSEENVKRQKLTDFELPVVILAGFPPIKEVEQFYLINYRQKRLTLDLAQRNYLDLAGNEDTRDLVPNAMKWEVEALKVIDALNEDSDSPWKGRISVPSDSEEEKKQKLYSQSSFIRALKPLFNSHDGKLGGASNEKKIELLKAFWKIVTDVYPECYENPKRYSLMRGVGINSLHRLLNLYDLSTDDDVEISLKDIKNKLTNAKNESFPVKFWLAPSKNKDRTEGDRFASFYSSIHGYISLANHLRYGREEPE